MELYFHNYSDCLSVWLASDELSVYVEWQWKYWDSLICFDAYMHQAPGGYKCDLCVADNSNSATLFPSREALWQDHLFDKFLNWVNEKLAPARWVRISKTRGGTWAELILDESKLSEPDRMMLFMQQLKSVDGEQAYECGTEGDTTWLVPLKPELG